MIQRGDMGWEVGGGSGLGTHVHLWRIHVNVWQNQYSIVKQNKVKIKIKKKESKGEKYQHWIFYSNINNININIQKAQWHPEWNNIKVDSM